MPPLCSWIPGDVDASGEWAMLGDWYTVPLSDVALHARDRDVLLRDPLFAGELLPLLFAEDRLTGRLEGDELTTALHNTANHRGIQLRPLSEAISDLATRRQAPTPRGDDAKATRPRTTPQPSPTSSPVTAFADPLATGAAHGRTWDPATRTWQAT